jgi:hypothetical protein
MTPHFLDNRLTGGGEVKRLPRFTQGIHFLFIYVRRWVNPRATVSLEALGKFKNYHSSRIEPVISRLAAQCINQLRYRVSPNKTKVNLSQDSGFHEYESLNSDAILLPMHSHDMSICVHMNAYIRFHASVHHLQLTLMFRLTSSSHTYVSAKTHCIILCKGDN